MTKLAAKQKKILLGAAAVIFLGVVGASIYKPQTYEEYLAKEKGNPQKVEQKTASGPQVAVESSLTLAVSDTPAEAVKLLEAPSADISSVDSILKFLDIRIPLTFGYKIKDVTFNGSAGHVVVDLITPSGSLEKEIDLRNVDKQWKLTKVASNNNNQVLFSTSDGAITMLIPQEMLAEDRTTEVGNAVSIYNSEGTIQIVLFITGSDVSELFAQMIDCTTGTCSKKDINGNSFDIIELIDKTSGENAYTARTVKNGVYFNIVGVAKSAETLETVRTIINTVRI